MKKSRRLASKLTMVIFALYVMVTLLIVRARAIELKADKENLARELEDQRIATRSSEDTASDLSDDYDDVARKFARGIGLIDPDEKLFVDISK